MIGNKKALVKLSLATVGVVAFFVFVFLIVNVGADDAQDIETPPFIETDKGEYVVFCGNNSAPVCGNGQIEDGEECDDGNTLNGDNCSFNCKNTACPFESKEGRTIVNFSEVLLSNQGYNNASTDNKSVSLSGYYNVSLYAYDGHSGRENQNQAYEQYKILFFNSSGDNIVNSSASADLADNVLFANWSGEVNSGLLILNATEVQGFHSAYSDSNPNSVYAGCAAFDKIGDIQCVQDDDCVGEVDACHTASCVDYQCVQNFSDKTGPVVENLSYAKVADQCKFDINALATDQCSNISEAKYWIGGATCGNLSNGVPMDPTDGIFDSIVEAIKKGGVDGVHDGSVNFHVMAKDSAGNWGTCVTSNIALDCLPPDFPTCEIGNTHYNPSLPNGILLLSEYVVSEGICNANETLVCGKDPTIRANVCDLESKIQHAEYFLNNMSLNNWWGINMTPMDGSWLDEECEDVEAVVNLSLLSEGTHYVQLHAKDSQGTWGKLTPANNPIISFIKDTTAPKTKKTLNPADDVSFECGLESANGSDLTDGCAYVKSGTIITLEARDFNPDDSTDQIGLGLGYNNLAGEYAGNVTINWKVYYAEDCLSESPVWTLNQSGVGNVNENVTITLNEDSCHLIEYWSVDSVCGNEETHHFELDIVDTTAPETTKVVGEPKIERESGIHYYITSGTEINLTCVDPQPHPVNNVALYWNVSWKEECGEGEWDLLGQVSGSSDGNATIAGLNDSCHKVDYYCVDALGNAEELKTEIDAVDNQAPEISKTIVGPRYGSCPCDDSTSLAGFETGDFTDWVVESSVDFVGVVTADSYASPLYGSYMAMLGNSGSSSQLIGNNEISRTFVVTEPTLNFAYHLNTHDYTGFNHFSYVVRFENGTVVNHYHQGAWGSGSSYKTTGWVPVSIDLSDYVGETLVFVVNVAGTSDTANPTWAYIDGANGDGCFVNNDLDDCFVDGVTEIHVGVTDPQPHPVGGVVCEWDYSVVGGDKTGTGQNEITSASFIVHFPEESNHTLTIICKDALNNTVEDVSNYIVDKTAPTTNLTYGTPLVEKEGVKWISNKTSITLNAWDNEPHPSGVKETRYRFGLVDDSFCWGNNSSSFEGLTGDWSVYSEAFKISEDSCHAIEYYSVDNVNKTEDVNVQFVFVDSRAPDTGKVLGEPKLSCEDGEEKCGKQGAWPAYYVTSETNITLSCNDQSPHPVGNETVCYRIEGPGYDNNLKCKNVSESKEWTFNYKKDSLHKLEWYCKDGLGNEGETQIEYDNVDNKGPGLFIWNPSWDEKDIKRCSMDILVEVWDYKSGVNTTSPIRAELRDCNTNEIQTKWFNGGWEGELCNGSVVRELNLTNYGNLTGLIYGGKFYSNVMDLDDLGAGKYTLYVYGEDNLGNENIEAKNVYLEKGIYVEYVDPSVCSVTTQDGGSCNFTFNACVRGSDSIKFYMDKVNDGAVDPFTLKAKIWNNEGEYGEVGLMEKWGSYWQPISTADLLTLDDCDEINGRETFNLTLEFNQSTAQLVGPGPYEWNYKIFSYVGEGNCSEGLTA